MTAIVAETAAALAGGNNHHHRHNRSKPRVTAWRARVKVSGDGSQIVIHPGVGRAGQVSRSELPREKRKAQRSGACGELGSGRPLSSTASLCWGGGQASVEASELWGHKVSFSSTLPCATPEELDFVKWCLAGESVTSFLLSRHAGKLAPGEHPRCLHREAEKGQLIDWRRRK